MRCAVSVAVRMAQSARHLAASIKPVQWAASVSPTLYLRCRLETKADADRHPTQGFDTGSRNPKLEAPTARSRTEVQAAFHIRAQSGTWRKVWESSLWRRGWDSNPRYRLRYTPLAGERLRPLGHLSTALLVSCEPHNSRGRLPVIGFWQGDPSRPTRMGSAGLPRVGICGFRALPRHPSLSGWRAGM